MVGKEISVKRYVVRLSGDEREQLEVLIRKGKSPAQRLLKARILLKADVSQAGDGWSDRVIKAPETSPSMIYRVRKQLVEEGFEAVLSRKQRATPAAAPIFDGEKEAKLIALACSKPPKGRARWTLRLLERKGRGAQDRRARQQLNDRSCFKKNTLKAPSPTVLGHPAQGHGAFVAAMEEERWFASTRLQSNSSPRRASSIGKAGPPGPLRLRVRAQRDRQPLHDVRAARRLALRRGDGSQTPGLRHV